MIARYVPFAELPQAALHGLVVSFADVGYTVSDLAEKLEAEELRVFVVGEGKSRCYTAVSVLETAGVKELHLAGLWVEFPGNGWQFRTWLEFCKALAVSWGCTRVTTMISNDRQLRALVVNGCKVRQVEVYLECGNGQQENTDHHVQ